MTNKSKELKQTIVRGRLHFVADGESVQCWLGEPHDDESEFIFSVHKSYAKEIIAGLTAIKHHCM